MSDMLATGTAWLSSTLQASASRSVTYERGALSVTFTATVGRTLLRLDDADGGSRIVWTDADICFPAALLVLGSATVLPQRGDRVRITFGSTVHIHEVLSPGNEPEYKFSDPGKTLLRVHLKKIGVVP